MGRGKLIERKERAFCRETKQTAGAVVIKRSLN